jgi:glutamate dehydrogenase/leucine dehydrogenase
MHGDDPDEGAAVSVRATMLSTPRADSALPQPPAGVHRASVIRYQDPVEGFEGYLAFDGEANPLAAGGFRVQRGLSADTVSRLAEAMTLKQRLLGLGVDGAKCGIDFDPRHPGKRDAMRRFVDCLRPYLLDRFSMGPDVGTSWGEIEGVARSQGIPSAKIAIAKAQGLSERELIERIGVLDTVVGGATLGDRRAGHGLAHAALGVGNWTPDLAGGAPRVAIQGFGTLGRAAVLSLTEAGLPIIAIADVDSCAYAGDGLPTEALVQALPGTPVSRLASSPDVIALPETLFTVPADLLILAACGDAMTPAQASALPVSVRAVVVGANLGLSADVEHLLHERGIIVVPDIVGGCGGSASMDALFGPVSCPTATQVLERTGASMHDLVHRLLDLTAASGCTLRDASATLCEQNRCAPATRPYGVSSA